MSSWSPGRIARWTALLAVVGGVVYLRCRPRPDFNLEWARESKNAEELVSYVDSGGKPGQVRGDLKRLHGAARARLTARGMAEGAPMNALLEAMLGIIENRIVLEMPNAEVERGSFEAVASLMVEPGTFVAPVADHLSEPSYGCAKGLSVVFADALGGDVVKVEIERFISLGRETPDRGRPVLSISWTARAGTRAYARANGKRLFPSIEVDADLTLTVGGRALATLHATAMPASDISYTSYGLGGLDAIYPESDGSDSDVFSGIVASTCEGLGRELLARLTGVAADGEDADAGEVGHDRTWCEEHDDARSCERLGLRYRDGDGVAVDKKRAEELLHTACAGGLGAAPSACAPAAELTLQSVVHLAPESELRGTARARATIALMDGCRYHDPASCVALGRQRAVPLGNETTISEYGARQAGIAWIHACALGVDTACNDAGRVLTPYSPLRASLLFHRACAADLSDACAAEKSLRAKASAERKLFETALPAGDEAFDIGWATLFDGDETELVWIASRSAPGVSSERLAREVAIGTATVFTPDAAPHAAPAWARSIYALGDGPRSEYHKRCPPCPHATGGLGISQCTCLPPLK